MPDKNAVHRAAAALRTALVGKQIVGFEAEKLSGPMPRLGRTVEDVVSHGRHLEICWDDDIVLHTNLGWRGSWELYRRGETWRKPQHMARVVVETIDWVAVCFKARDVETYRPDSFIRHPNFGRLGPDLHDANADINECVRRLMTYENPTIAIADVLLDQHVATGIGNVYRCEVLWSSEVHPLAPVGLLPQSTCVEIVRTACALLQQQNAESSSDLFAYGRNGQPCKRCGGVIALRYHGSPARLLYWCPSCQLGCAPAPDSDISDPIARLTDPHPAGSMYISEMVQNHGLFSDNGNQAAS